MNSISLMALLRDPIAEACAMVWMYNLKSSPKLLPLQQLWFKYIGLHFNMHGAWFGPIKIFVRPWCSSYTIWWGHMYLDPSNPWVFWASRSDIRALCRLLEFFYTMPQWSLLCVEKYCHAATGLGLLFPVKRNRCSSIQSHSRLLNDNGRS